MNKKLLLCMISVLSIAEIGNYLTAQDKPTNNVSFNRDIRPILSDRCFACHGPDAEAREADLRLDIASGINGEPPATIEPGSIDDSELWHRITSDDASELMPPPDSNQLPLSETEKELIKSWINSGGAYETFWAFNPVTQPALPNVEDPNWSQQPIDLYVLNKLESVGMPPTKEATDRTLIRRLTFDLTGLPPTRKEIRDYLDEKSKIGEAAWENLVDRLLSQKQHGEHMARYWLDVVRFADTNGMHKDFYRNNFAYRDWVIRAFNENLGYDDFIRYQLAGDLYETPTTDQLVASGFHRLHLIIDRGTALPEESFAKNVLDRVTAVGTGFMGMTLHCAQCHDHKYDPISQKDYFSLYAFFNNIDAAPETQFRPPNGLQRPFISFASSSDKEKLAKFDSEIARFNNEINKLNTIILNPPNPDEIQSLKQNQQDLKAKLKSRQKERNLFEQSIPGAMVMKERPEVRETFVLDRGQYDSPGEKVTRNTPEFLPALNKQGEIASRMDLAEWFVAPQNPLTARVAVNRFWQQFFGVGLFKTSEDIGAQGDLPSHPELLDHLSFSLVESNWDVRALIKQIVMSKTYRQSSQATPEQFKKDPENRLLARGSRYRMDAEMIRDQILATSGLLSKQMYGASVKPPQPDGLWKAVTMTGQKFTADSGESIYRRSVYTFWKRAMPPPQMTILNAPIRDACITRRERTNTPSQALLLLNETEYLKAARHLAIDILKQESDLRIEYAWEVVTSQIPDEKERSEISKLVKQLTQQYLDNPELAAQICSESNPGSEVATPELAAWTVVGNLLYNLDITKTKE